VILTYHSTDPLDKYGRKSLRLMRYEDGLVIYSIYDPKVEDIEALWGARDADEVYKGYRERKGNG